MLYVIFSFVIILLYLKFTPHIDKTKDGKVLLWYGDPANRHFIIIKNK